MVNKKTGKIIRWQDDKGFGFIQTENHSEIFFHINEYRAKSRPIVGEEVVFEASYDNQQRACAKNVQQAQFVKQQIACQNTFNMRQQEQQLARQTLNLWVGFGIAFMLILMTCVIIKRLPTLVLGWYFAISLATFLLYAHDKNAAQSNSWRVKEETLHKLALAGGWIGAAFAHKLLNHKSRKASFRQGFYMSVVGNILLLTILWWFKFK